MGFKRCRNAALFLFLLASVGLAAFVEAGPQEIASTTVGPSRIDWIPMIGFGCLQLSVSGGKGFTFERSFNANEMINFEVPASGLSDGSYGWQLSRSETACGHQLEKKVFNDGDALKPSKDDKHGRPAAQKGRPERIPSGPYTQSGRFKVENGSIVIPDPAKQERGRR